MIQTDVLVVGSGAAGLVYAIKLARECPNKKVTIITKADPAECNTKYAQGGVAVVLDNLKDNFENHIEDTLRAGDGRCKREVVEMVVRDASTRIMELAEWGVSFDLDQNGTYDLGREGGHSHNRVIHHKDNTGEAIEQVLLTKISELKNIQMLDFHLAVELLLSADGKTCIGADVLNIRDGNIERIMSHIMVLATGGCGCVYEHTTNPMTSTGDGIALAIRAKAEVSDMQYIQFHPTAVYDTQKGKLALVSEAMRGAGARLLNSNKEPFMHKYDERGELASRDIVSKAIYQEMKLHKSNFVYLDCRHVAHEIVMSHFPNIYEECKSRGYDLIADLLPIVPASHYLCGGIDVDMNGRTSISKLYAIGECSNTGLHGANRLASNSLLEALVYGNRAAKDSESVLNNSTAKVRSSEEIKHFSEDDDKNRAERIRAELNSIMSSYVGIVRTNADLIEAKNACENLEKQFISAYNVTSQETRNMLCVSKAIIEQSLSQKTNAGTFYNTDLDERN